MTYRQLLDALLTLSQEQLNQNVTIELLYPHSADPERFGVAYTYKTQEDEQVIDPNHLVITVDLT